MCPLAPAAPPPGLISSCWTDDQIILSLDQINCGAPIPDDVIVDDPYQYNPSNLPDGAWFLVKLAEKKATTDGFWLANGEACEIFANSAICGWRTTFEFFEIEALFGQKTAWMIQEYKITQKGQHNQTKLKESALCRVFSCCNDNLNNEAKSEHNNNVIKDQTEGTGPSLGDKVSDPSGDDIFAELDCILRGDYLELNDLVDDLASHSSSSGNSSCQSFASDVCFDSLALLRDLDEDKKQDLDGKGSSSNYSIMMCGTSNDVVMQPALLESLVEAGGAAAKDKGTEPNKDKFPSESSPGQAAKRLKAECEDEGPSYSYRATGSSSSSSGNSHEPVTRREEKRMKKFKICFCFMPY